MNAMNNIKTICNKYLWLFIGLCIIPSLQIAGFESMGYYKPLSRILQVFIFVVLIYFYIKKRIKLSKLLIVLLIMTSLLLVNTAVRGNFDNTVSCFSFVISCLTFGFVIELFKNSKSDLLKGLLIVFELIIYLNFLVIIYKLPTGYVDGKTYFFGHYNISIYYLLTGQLISYLCFKEGVSRARPIMLTLTCVASVFLTESSTAKAIEIVITLFAFFIFLYHRLSKGKDFPVLLVTIPTIIFSTIILITLGNIDLDIYKYFVEEILHRSTSLTGRTTIWTSAFQLVKENSLIGYGYKGYLLEVYTPSNNPHNYYLYCLLIGGTVGLAVFAMFNIVYWLRIDEYKGSTKIFFMAITLGMLMSMLTEGVKQFCVYYIIYFLIYNYKETSN